jgi:hypothetical protein
MALEQLDPAQRQMLLHGDWNAREPGDWVIGDPAWVDAAVELGARMWDAGPPPPVDECIDTGTDWGEITQSYVIWELEHGGVFIPPSEVKEEHKDPAITSHAILQTAMRYNWPYREARYDAAGVQSMRTYLGIARNVPGLERLRSMKVPFNLYKTDGMNYLRTLFRRTAAGETTRIIAIHPDNEELIYQLKGWRRKGPETSDVIKEDDHGPDAVVAGIAPIAKRYREFIEEAFQAAITPDEPWLEGADPAVVEALQASTHRAELLRQN